MNERSTYGRLVAGLLTCVGVWAHVPAASADALGPVRSLLEIRRENVVTQQWDLSCGAAALATVLAYQHGDPIPEKEIARAMIRRTDPLRVKIRGGFSLLDLKRYVESRGYTGVGYTKLTLDALEKFGPTLVPLRLKGYDHFVVFKGITGGDVLFADPAFGNRRLPIDAFNEAWISKIGFLVRRKDGAPPLNNRLVARPYEAAGPSDALISAGVR
jgi:predicted double-glycine peptidase